MWTDLLVHFAKIVVVLHAILFAVAYLVLAERKVAAWMQDRIGPNRVGPRGLLQPFADLLKFVFKEDLVPEHVEKPLYRIAPALTLVPAFLAFAVIPFGKPIEIFGRRIPLLLADLDVGMLYVFAISSLGVYGIALGGWASNSKYSMLGGIRSSAQMISYEICIGLSVVAIFMLSGSLRLTDVVEAQRGPLWNWFVFQQPLAFFLFLVSGFAETNRLPFDLPEAETELVAGYHTEYSSVKFALYFLAEYANMITLSAAVVTLFLGGYHVPFAPDLGLPPLLEGLASAGVFAAKVAALLFFMIWVRWTLPRFRFDQLMNLGWKVFLPLGVANILVTGAISLALSGPAGGGAAAPLPAHP